MLRRQFWGHAMPRGTGGLSADNYGPKPRAPDVQMACQSSCRSWNLLTNVYSSYIDLYRNIYAFIFIHFSYWKQLFLECLRSDWGADSTLSNHKKFLQRRKELYSLFYSFFIIFSISFFYSILFISFRFRISSCKRICHLDQMTTISWPVNPFLYATGTQLGRNPNVTVPCARAVASPAWSALAFTRSLMVNFGQFGHAVKWVKHCKD